MGGTSLRITGVLVALAFLGVPAAGAETGSDSQATGSQASGSTQSANAQADGNGAAPGAANGGSGSSADASVTGKTLASLLPLTPRFEPRSEEGKELAEKISAQYKELADKIAEHRKEAAAKLQEMLKDIAQGKTEEAKQLAQEMRDARKQFLEETKEQRSQIAQEIQDAISKGLLKGRPFWVNFLRHTPIEPFWVNFLRRKPEAKKRQVTVRWPVDMSKLKLSQPAVDVSKLPQKLERKPLFAAPGQTDKPARSPGLVIQKDKLIRLTTVPVLPAGQPGFSNKTKPVDQPVVSTPASKQNPVRRPVVALPSETSKPLNTPVLTTLGGGSQTVHLPKLELSGNTLNLQGLGQPGSIQITGKPAQVRVQPQPNLKLDGLGQTRSIKVSGKPAEIKIQQQNLTPPSGGQTFARPGTIVFGGKQ